MQDLDKAALGARIRRIRSQAGLRQWELARFLGTTQSAVHKYEHGVVPEPRRLVEMARIGETSIEWILTGRHWENGSDDPKRVTPDLLETACALRDLTQAERASVDEALRILRDAVQALSGSASADKDAAIAISLRAHSQETLRLLEAAWRIQTAVLERVARDAGARLASSPLLDESGSGPEGSRADPPPPG